jgi:hypothetical protein
MINPPLGGQISKSPKRYKDARYKIQDTNNNDSGKGNVKWMFGH